MTTTHQLARILATRTEDGIELAIETETGEIMKVAATEDQIDDLVEELDDLLASDDEEEDAPAAA